MLTPSVFLFVSDPKRDLGEGICKSFLEMMEGYMMMKNKAFITSLPAAVKGPAVFDPTLFKANKEVLDNYYPITTHHRVPRTTHIDWILKRSTRCRLFNNMHVCTNIFHQIQISKEVRNILSLRPDERTPDQLQTVRKRYGELGGILV